MRVVSPGAVIVIVVLSHSCDLFSDVEICHVGILYLEC